MSNQPGPMLSYETPRGRGLGFRVHFESAHGNAVATMTLVAAATLLNCAAIWADYAQVLLLQQIKLHIPLLPGQAQQNDLRVRVIAIAATGVTIAGIVVWVIWAYRAYRNLQPLNGQSAKHTAGSAAGGFFIPIVNLVRIPQVMTELWNDSDPAGHGGGLLVLCWWLAWIAGGIAAQVAKMSTTPVYPGGRPDIDSLISMTWTFLASHVLVVAAGSLAVWLVWGIDDRQRRRAIMTGR
ncbi:MAG: DUF4328 domain-containing protein [Tepidisphaeraceae bacterium]